MPELLDRLKTALADRYAIEREIGAGGMATVYIAHDLKHDRKVAIKVLRPELAAVLGAERFLNEIKVTANLQHPNILPLYDSGEAESFLYYVMPFIEGESLREKINRETQLRVEETVEIAKSVAAALQYAHDRDIVHRDIKPENILLQSGQALVADFGIALAVSVAGGPRLTETGLSLGTPQYMSPEQATGDRELDARSDVYSLGCVVYEMLVGDPPHTGSTVQAVIAKVLSEQPSPITQARSLVPGNVDAAVQQAIAKSPADRFQTAVQFAEALTNPAFTLPAATGVTQRAEPRGPLTRLSIAFASLAVLFAAAAVWALLRPQPEIPLFKVSVALPEGEAVVDPWAGSPLTLSAVDSTLVYLGSNGAGGWQLWGRRGDELQATPLVDVGGAVNPVLSPDGRAVAFVAEIPGPIHVVPLGAGTARQISVSARPFALDWGRDDALYYLNDAGGISRVPAGGGEPEVLTVVDTARGEFEHSWVDVLPSGNGALFTIFHVGLETDEIAAVRFGTAQISVLTQGAYARYAASGHLVWTTAEGSVWAARFDEAKLEVTGAPVRVLEGVRVGLRGAAHLALSETGTLVYRTGSGVTLVEPVWVERDGTARAIDPEWRIRAVTSGNQGLALSPDGSRLALNIWGDGSTGLWIKRLDRGPLSRVTFEGRYNDRPFWMADGRSVAFVSDRSGRLELWSKVADASAPAKLLWDDERSIDEGLFSRDGKWLVYRVGSGNDRDLYAIRPGTDNEPTVSVATEFEERSPALSPNTRWLAYVSNDTGRDEVYVRPFPNVEDARVQISTAGGYEPVWAHSGRELFYRNGANELVVLDVTAEGSFAVGRQRALFSMAGFHTDPNHAVYDLSPDDERFVMLRHGKMDPGELIWIQNWFEELKEKVGN